MNTSHIHDDYVFENRNRSYGAYVLRMSYNDNMSKAILISTSIVLALLMVYCIYLNKTIKETIDIPHDVTTLTEVEYQPLKEEVKIPEPKPLAKSNPSKDIATTAYVEPKVVKNLDGKQEELVPIVDSLQKSVISTATQSGVSSDPYQDTAPIKNNSSTGEGKGKDQSSGVDTTSIATMAEVFPEFPGGLAALQKFLGQHIKYPPVARENNIQGRVSLKFVVSRTGQITDIKAMTKFGGGLEEEAIRVVKLMPNWKPGKIRNTNVNVAFVLPIQFKLSA